MTRTVPIGLVSSVGVDVGQIRLVNYVRLVVEVASIVERLYDGVLVATGRIQVVADVERRTIGPSVITDLIDKATCAIKGNATKLRRAVGDHIDPGLRVIAIAGLLTAAVNRRVLRPF